MTPADDMGARLGQIERETAAMEQQLRDIVRTIDRLIPHGEQLVELRALLNGLAEDIKWLRAEAASIRESVAENTAQRLAAEKERRTDRRDDRRLQWQLSLGLLVAIISAVSGIIAAGVSP